MPTAPDIALGTFVTHRTQPAWGLGKVIHLTSERVYVYFRDVEGTPKEAVKNSMFARNAKQAILPTAVVIICSSDTLFLPYRTY